MKQQDLVDFSGLAIRTVQRIEAGKNLDLNSVYAIYVIARILNFNCWVLRCGRWTIERANLQIVDLINELDSRFDQLTPEQIRIVQYVKNEISRVANVELVEGNWESRLFFRNIVNAFVFSDVLSKNSINGENLNSIIGKNLKTIRQNSGISQEKMSEKIGIDFDTYRRAELGRICSLSTLVKMSDTLCISIDELLSTETRTINDILDDIFSIAVLMDTTYNI